MLTKIGILRKIYLVTRLLCRFKMGKKNPKTVLAKRRFSENLG